MSFGTLEIRRAFRCWAPLQTRLSNNRFAQSRRPECTLVVNKLWSPFGSSKYQVPYYHRDPNADHTFDNHPHPKKLYSVSPSGRTQKCSLILWKPEHAHKEFVFNGLKHLDTLDLSGNRCAAMTKATLGAQAGREGWHASFNGQRNMIPVYMYSHISVSTYIFKSTSIFEETAPACYTHSFCMYSLENVLRDSFSGSLQLCLDPRRLVE